MLKVQEIRELIKLVDQSSIDEFTYEENGTTVSMKKSSENRVGHLSENVLKDSEQPKVSREKVVDQVPPVKKEEPEAKVEEPTVTTNTNYDHEIVSPMVGTLYISPSPESDPYVKSGSSVQNDTVVCIVEAMKLFNEIEAEVTGEIVEILAEDGELVEYGQPLFRVKTK
ncbi:acetyl-CoA carboxylase biotin carboxyl carrier protein [Virgibacillus byunsanensis]|uniref:Biotin carboxyl carrier protein of acetyl-CoA carboxylase n=1 Tax=Virgibacillus byunsanensis TaxID=570945 RepID=A0ABW3LPA1_9BACI